MLDLFPFMSNKNNDRNQKNIFDNLFDEGFINNIIGQVMNSDFINDLTNELANDEGYDIDFKDDGEYYLIKGYLPGLNPKDISIDFEKNKAILTIKNKRVYSNSSGNSNFTVIRAGGDIVKTFYIDEIDVTNLRASFKDELLTITIPKARLMVDGNNSKIIDVDNYKVE